MYFHANDKVTLFIDGANLYATAKALDFDIDYRRLLKFFRDRSHLIRAMYYTALIDDANFSPVRPLIDWLDYNGYAVVTKPTREFTDTTGRRKVKGNMDIELAVNMMEILNEIDHVVLFSGDGDFRSLLEAVQRKGRKVTVISTMITKPPMVSDELRRQADQFIDLHELRKEIGQKSGENPMHIEIQKETARKQQEKVTAEDDIDDFEKMAGL